uniref:Ribosomal protein S3 n=1 Tax=Moneuplotes minuta TaxID=74792 RepID=D1LDN7_9SPIT|nr:ribosomal protein S3 [Moneuplotes minuta]
MRTLRRQLNNSRSSFWASVSHWTAKPLKFKYYQLNLTLNRSPWLPRLGNWSMTVPESKYYILNRNLWTYIPHLFHNQDVRCFSYTPRALYFFKPHSIAGGTLQRIVGIKPLNAPLCNYFELTPRSTLELTPSPLLGSNKPLLSITNTYSTFLKSVGTISLLRLINHALSGLTLNLPTRTQMFKKQIRVRYLQFLRRGGNFRINSLITTRNKNKRHRNHKQLGNYNFTEFYRHKGMHRVGLTLIDNSTRRGTTWWYRTVTRGLRNLYRLGIYTNAVNYSYLNQHPLNHTKVNPIFFLFFRSLPSRLRYRNTHCHTQSALILKLMIWQQKFTANPVKKVDDFSNPVQQVRCINPRTNLPVQPKRARLLVRALSRGSLLPSPYTAHYKRTWFTLRDKFVRASRRLLRFCLPWRSGLFFLNQRRRQNRSFFTQFSVFRDTNLPTILKARRRFFIRGGLTPLNTAYGDLIFSGLQLSKPLHTGLLPQTENLNESLVGTKNNIHNYVKTKALSSTLGLFHLTATRIIPQTTNNLMTYLTGQTDMKNLTLRYWRLLISGELTNDKPRRRFVPLRGAYVSTYFSSYINRFFEYFLGTRVGTIVNFEILARVSPVDFFLLESIKSRLHAMNSAFSTIFFINEFIDLLFMALRLRNFSHLISYINRLLKSLVIWDHKRFFVFFFSAFREQFLPFFPSLGITGLQIIIRGKVGVGGNSRKRSMALRLGVTSRTHTFINTHTLNTWLNTTTGALGLRIFLYGTNNIGTGI